MPKAFTYLCTEVNLSLFDDTLTIYPKNTYHSASSDQFMSMYFEMDCSTVKFNEFFYDKKSEMGACRYVRRDDPDHALYHQDKFSIENWHSHAQFERTIDTRKLESILSILEKNTLISTAEGRSILQAYQNANSLPGKVQLSKEQKNKNPIQAGDKVIIKGLTGKKSTAINGRTAIVDSFDTNTNQFLVNLPIEVNDPALEVDDLVVIRNRTEALNGKTVRIAGINKDRFIVDFYNLGKVNQETIKPENLQYQISIELSNLELEAKQELENTRDCCVLS